MDAFWLFLIFTALPMYLANASAMVFGGKTPVDGNKTLSDGQPLFGKGKTWKGTVMGIIIGSLAGFFADHFFPELTHGVSPVYVQYAVLLSIGAIIGDIAGSFLKRRLRIKSGQPAHLLDQLDFVIGGLAFSLFIVSPNWTSIFVLIMITPFLHMTFNRLAYMLKIKSVPW